MRTEPYSCVSLTGTASMASATVIVAYLLLTTSMAIADGQSAPVVTPITSPDESNTSSALYTVRDGNKVDAKALAGLTPERRHGSVTRKGPPGLPGMPNTAVQVA